MKEIDRLITEYSLYADCFNKSLKEIEEITKISHERIAAEKQRDLSRIAELEEVYNETSGTAKTLIESEIDGLKSKVYETLKSERDSVNNAERSCYEAMAKLQSISVAFEEAYKMEKASLEEKRKLVIGDNFKDLRKIWISSKIKEFEKL